MYNRFNRGKTSHSAIQSLKIDWSQQSPQMEGKAPVCQKKTNKKTLFLKYLVTK